MSSHLGRMVHGGRGDGSHQANHPPSLALILSRVQAASASSASSCLNHGDENAQLGPPAPAPSPVPPAAASSQDDGMKRSESNWSFMDDHDSNDSLLQQHQQQLLLQQQQQQQLPQSDSGCHSASSLSPAPTTTVAPVAAAPRMAYLVANASHHVEIRLRHEGASA